MATSDNREPLWFWLFTAWMVALVSTLGSLFFSEVMGLIPCELCWYQRIALFPLAVILLIGLHPVDHRVIRYSLPLVVIGLLFTLYHLLLFYGFVPDSMVPCSKGVSCSGADMELFGWLPIPWLSLLAFAAILFALLKARAVTQE